MSTPEGIPGDVVDYMALNGYVVAGFLGQADNFATVELAGRHLPVITAMVRSYTRDRGFTDDEPVPDLAAVIITATARAVQNPAGTESQTTGPFAIRLAVFDGFTLAELAVLNRYRVRAA